MLVLCPHFTHYSVLGYNKKHINDRESWDCSAEEDSNGDIKDISVSVSPSPWRYMAVPSEADQSVDGPSSFCIFKSVLSQIRAVCPVLCPPVTGLRTNNNKLRFYIH